MRLPGGFDKLGLYIVADRVPFTPRVLQGSHQAFVSLIVIVATAPNARRSGLGFSAFRRAGWCRWVACRRHISAPASVKPDWPYQFEPRVMAQLTPQYPGRLKLLNDFLGAAISDAKPFTDQLIAAIPGCAYGFGCCDELGFCQVQFLPACLERIGQYPFNPLLPQFPDLCGWGARDAAFHTDKPDSNIFSSKRRNQPIGA